MMMAMVSKILFVQNYLLNILLVQIKSIQNKSFSLNLLINKKRTCPGNIVLVLSLLSLRNSDGVEL